MAMRIEADSADGLLEARGETVSLGAPPTLPPLAVRARDVTNFYHLRVLGGKVEIGSELELATRASGQTGEAGSDAG